MARKTSTEWRAEMRTLPGRVAEAKRSMVATLVLAGMATIWLILVAYNTDLGLGLGFTAVAPIAGIIILAAGLSVQRYEDLRTIRDAWQTHDTAPEHTPDTATPPGG